jgi:hypothetical protein
LCVAVSFLIRLMEMWDCMLVCHRTQYEEIERMGPLDGSLAPRWTDKQHAENTAQLENEIRLWQENLGKLVQTQREYMQALNHWLMLHISQIESDGKDAPSSPLRVVTPPVYLLCQLWCNILDRMPEALAMNALKAFLSLLHDLLEHQGEELRQKKRLESLRQELERKEQQLSLQLAKHREKWAAAGEMGGSSSGSDEAGQGQEQGQGQGQGQGHGHGQGPASAALQERERSVKLLRDAVESERFKYEQMCSKSGTMALASLDKGLPPVLKAMRDFAEAALQCYTELHSICDSRPSLPQIAY